ncbi:MAG TPA: Rho termination factor N-terminal domain-containing protein, partial [Jiangellaceae bacterium]|nr:Rho termination factor N-terminal domain-containing protein [Jiangellaceae bacterium]
RSTRPAAPRLRRGGPTAGGADANASKRHLHEVAQRLDIAGHSTMPKSELVAAIERENARTRRSR